MHSYIRAFFEELDNHPELDKDSIAKLKVKLCKKHSVKDIPTDIQLLLHASKETAEKFRKRLQTKPGRSLSGVAPIAIMTSPAPCPHGKCRMCPGGLEGAWGVTPQSYTGAEPATMRAMRANYDPYLQVFNRLEQYAVTGHIADKIDLIIMGGTFPARKREYQDEFIMYAFKALNDFSETFFDDGDFLLETFKNFFELPGVVGDPKRTQRIHKRLLKLKRTGNLNDEKKKNETAMVRCIGLTVETKPDWGFLEQGNVMLEQGCTRVELGVQSVYDKALEAVNRGHSVLDNKRSIQQLKDLGFKLNFHMMLGLPKVTQEEDLQGLRWLFDDEGYRPDMLKLYPCMVMPKTPLLDDFKKGLFTPLSTQEAAEIISEAFRFIPTYCRVMRVQRDIPTYRTQAGVDRTNLRQYVDELLKQKNILSMDIRAREAGRKQAHQQSNMELIVVEYVASGGKEFFISVEDTANDVLVGFCRLRFPGQQLRKEITPTTALIRELHVYGSAVALGGDDEGSVQHKGYGKQLMAKAEKIARQHGYDKLLVISGVGVREYYRKLGYCNDGPYVAKKL